MVVAASVLPRIRRAFGDARNERVIRETGRIELVSMFFTFKLKSISGGSLYKTAYACEGSQLGFACPEGQLISLIRANYGRFSISICNEHGTLDWSVDCKSNRSYNVIRDSCPGEARKVRPLMRITTVCVAFSVMATATFIKAVSALFPSLSFSFLPVIESLMRAILSSSVNHVQSERAVRVCKVRNPAAAGSVPASSRRQYTCLPLVEEDSDRCVPGNRGPSTSLTSEYRLCAISLR
ncbi:hypothetical protein HPB51_016310 [Rhipicephalus microplus]|uniref:Uncharacterized protein n=1 Tax=Rhipicephalus microplus TaxID=6941 RepID=A0A9J6ENQ5_RHIMP|nr:hypothetical protein HPB51_016310 [Rhipicephalus microplus]